MDIVALLVAVAALAVAVLVFVRARATEQKALAARRDAAGAFERSAAAALEASAASENGRRSRQDSAEALDRSARAHQEAEEALRHAVETQARVERVVAGLEGPKEPAAPDGADEAAPPVPSASPPVVSWTLEHLRGPHWVLRNAGAGVAHAALLTEATQPPRYIRPAEVIPRDVSPGDHLQFRASVVRDAPPPRVRVAWREDGVDDARSTELTLIAE